MSTKEQTPKEWSDPKDFGLPFVEIKPLSSLKAQTKVEAVRASPPKPLDESVAVKPKEEKKKENTSSRPVSPPVTPVSSAKKKSKSWVWLVVLGGLALVSVIVWQIQSTGLLLTDTKKKIEKPVAKVEQKAPALPTPSTTALADSTVLASPTVAPAATSLPAATNAASAPLNLISITEKGERARFFLVVASLPSEKLITQFAQHLPLRPQEMYLIAPYPNSSNYRLALGKFDSWKVASEELARAKSQYTEDLWILNY